MNDERRLRLLEKARPLWNLVDTLRTAKNYGLAELALDCIIHIGRFIEWRKGKGIPPTEGELLLITHRLDSSLDDRMRILDLGKEWRNEYVKTRLERELHPFCYVITERRLALGLGAREAARNMKIDYTNLKEIEAGGKCSLERIGLIVGYYFPITPGRQDQTEIKARKEGLLLGQDYKKSQLGAKWDEQQDIAAKRALFRTLEKSGENREILRQRIIGIMRKAREEKYSPEKLTNMIIAETGFSQTELGGHSSISQPNLSKLLSEKSPPHKGRICSKSKWATNIADALLLTLMGLKDEYLTLLDTLLYSDITIRNFRTIAEEKGWKGYGLKPKLVECLSELCNEHVGKGKTFPSIRAIEKQAGFTRDYLYNLLCDKQRLNDRTLHDLTSVIPTDEEDRALIRLMWFRQRHPRGMGLTTKEIMEKSWRYGGVKLVDVLAHAIGIPVTTLLRESLGIDKNMADSLYGKWSRGRNPSYEELTKIGNYIFQRENEADLEFCLSEFIGATSITTKRTSYVLNLAKRGLSNQQAVNSL